MLMWGDFGFLPWMYTNSFTGYMAALQGRYQGSLGLDIFCVCLWIGAMVLFRLANSEKHKFRSYVQEGNDPREYKVWGKPAQWIETKEGSLILTSGFWGLCRHPNYTPDLVMAFAWWLNCTAYSNVPL